MAATVKKVEPTERQEWEARLTQVARDADKAQWEIGDLISEAKSEWGDTYTLAAAITGKKQKTLRNWVLVASKVEKSRRRDNLTFGHHAVVAGKSPGDQDKWLKKAEEDNWSVEDFRLKVQTAGTGGDTDPKDRVVVMVPRGLYPRFIKAANASGTEQEMKKAVAEWLLQLGEKEAA